MIGLFYGLPLGKTADAADATQSALGRDAMVMIHDIAMSL